MAGEESVSLSTAARLKKHLRSWWFWTSIAVIVVFFIVMMSLRIDLQV